MLTADLNVRNAHVFYYNLPTVHGTQLTSPNGFFFKHIYN